MPKKRFRSPDYIEIVNTIAHYGAYADQDDIHTYLEMFTKDGVLDIFTKSGTFLLKLKGEEVLLDGFEKVLAQRKGAKFKILQAIPIVDKITKEKAITRTMFTAYTPNQDQTSIPIFMIAWYHDLWRKTADGWKIAYRIEHPSSKEIHT